MIDQEWGINLIVAGEAAVEKYAVYTDIHIYGETEGEETVCKDRYGMAYPSFGFAAKPLHPEPSSALPISKLKSEGSWYGMAIMERVTFHGFKTSELAGCSGGQK